MDLASSLTEKEEVLVAIIVSLSTILSRLVKSWLLASKFSKIASIIKSHSFKALRLSQPMIFEIVNSTCFAEKSLRSTACCKICLIPLMPLSTYSMLRSASITLNPC